MKNELKESGGLISEFPTIRKHYQSWFKSWFQESRDFETYEEVFWFAQKYADTLFGYETEETRGYSGVVAKDFKKYVLELLEPYDSLEENSLEKNKIYLNELVKQDPSWNVLPTHLLIWSRTQNRA